MKLSGGNKHLPGSNIFPLLQVPDPYSRFTSHIPRLHQIALSNTRGIRAVNKPITGEEGRRGPMPIHLARHQLPHVFRTHPLMCYILEQGLDARMKFGDHERYLYLSISIALGGALIIILSLSSSCPRCPRASPSIPPPSPPWRTSKNHPDNACALACFLLPYSSILKSSRLLVVFEFSLALLSFSSRMHGTRSADVERRDNVISYRRSRAIVK